MAEIVKRKIVVNVGYFEFDFNDLCAANAFAIIAKSHLKEGDKGRHVGIIVDYDFEEVEEEDKEVVYTDTDSIKIRDKDEEEWDDQTTD